MHIVEKVSNDLRIGPQKNGPKLPTSFFPLPFNNYITIINESQVDSNYYNYMQDVLDDIFPELKKLNIHVVHVLNKENERSLRGSHVVGGLSLSQINYLISHSMLHICTDPYSNEIAGCFGTKSISLVGNRYDKNFYPWYGNLNNQVISNLPKDQSPSFSLNENPKIINEIKPETISNLILKKLSIDYSLDFETVFFGDRYRGDFSCDIIPNFPVSSKMDSKFGEIHLRMDLENSEMNAAQFLRHSPANLICKSTPSDRFLSAFKGNLKNVLYLITATTDPDDVQKAVDIGSKVHVVCDISEKDNEYKKRILYKFIDFRVSFFDIKNIAEDGKTFKTKKLFLSNGQLYPSLYHAQIKEPYKEKNNFYSNKHSAFEQQFFMVRN